MDGLQCLFCSLQGNVLIKKSLHLFVNTAMHLNTTQTQEVGGWKPVRKEKHKKKKQNRSVSPGAGYKNIGTTQEEEVLTF